MRKLLLLVLCGTAFAQQSDWRSQVKNMPFIDVTAKPYGAKGDNSNDDTAEIQAAITAAQATASGGTVFVPCGKYRVSTLNITEDQVTLMGAGHCSEIVFIGSGSVIKLNGASSTFNAAGTGEKNTVKNLYIWSTAPTGVTGVEVINQNSVTVSDVFVYSVQTGYVFNNVFQAKLLNSQLSGWGVAGAGSAVFVTNGTADLFIKECFFGSGTSGHSGIRISDTGGVTVQDTGVLYHAGAGVLTDPGNSQSVKNLWFINTQVDAGTGIGYSALPTGTGLVSGVHWVNSWTNTTDNTGVRLAASGSAVVEEVFFNSHRSWNNYYDGFNLVGSGVSKIYIQNSSIASNSRAANVATVSTITVLTGTGTATTSAPHGFSAGQTVTLSGGTGGSAVLNGAVTILTVGASSFTFSTIVVDGTYAGDFAASVPGGIHDGIRIGTGVSKVTVTGNYIGRISWLPRDHAVGVEFESGVGSGLIVKDNFIEGYAVTPIFGTTKFTTAATDYYQIQDNIPVDQNSAVLTAATTTSLGDAPYSYYTISGVTAIDTISPAWQNRTIYLRATGAGVNTTTAGNIQVAITLTQDRLYTLVHRNGKWQISN
jgi:hypothetical protein